MKMPCDKAVRCPDPNLPLSNFSSEDPDRLLEFGRYYVGPDGPPFDPIHIEENTVISGCTTYATGLLRDLADQCAARQAAECTSQTDVPDPCLVCRGPNDPTDGGFFSVDQNQVGQDPCCDPDDPVACCCDPEPTDPDPVPPPPPPAPQPPPLFGNTAQTCTVFCPDGSPYSYTVRAGVFVGQSQAYADRMAYSEACRLAYETMICITDFDVTMCKGQAEESHLSASVRKGEASFSLGSGSLPPGLSLLEDGSIVGTPTSVGTSSFVVKVCDGLGRCNTKIAHITVMEITNTSLANGSYGVAYLDQLHASGGVPPYSFSNSGGGPLPSGLGVGSNGLISGTPVQCGNFTPYMVVTDSTGKSCVKAIPLFINGVRSAAFNSTLPCINDPSKSVTISSPEGAYCQPVGSSQNTVDSIAWMNATNAARAALEALGCTCMIGPMSTTDAGPNGMLMGAPTTSPCTVDLYLDPASNPVGPHIVLTNATQPFHLYGAYFGQFGQPPHGLFKFHLGSPTGPVVAQISFP